MPIRKKGKSGDEGESPKDKSGGTAKRILETLGLLRPKDRTTGAASALFPGKDASEKHPSVVPRSVTESLEEATPKRRRSGYKRNEKGKGGSGEGRGIVPRSLTYIVGQEGQEEGEEEEECAFRSGGTSPNDVDTAPAILKVRSETAASSGVPKQDPRDSSPFASSSISKATVGSTVESAVESTVHCTVESHDGTSNSTLTDREIGSPTTHSEEARTPSKNLPRGADIIMPMTPVQSEGTRRKSSPLSEPYLEPLEVLSAQPLSFGPGSGQSQTSAREMEPELSISGEAKDSTAVNGAVGEISLNTRGTMSSMGQPQANLVSKGKRKAIWGSIATKGSVYVALVHSMTTIGKVVGKTGQGQVEHEDVEAWQGSLFNAALLLTVAALFPALFLVSLPMAFSLLGVALVALPFAVAMLLPIGLGLYLVRRVYNGSKK